MNFNKIFGIFFISIILLFGTPLLIKEKIINIDALGSGVIFGNRVYSIMPMPTCSNQYSCSACIHCGCGAWEDFTVSPDFGGVGYVAMYACKMSSFTPRGQQCTIGSVIFGPAASNILSINDGQSTNIQCQMQ